MEVLAASEHQAGWGEQEAIREAGREDGLETWSSAHFPQGALTESSEKAGLRPGPWSWPQVEV